MSGRKRRSQAQKVQIRNLAQTSSWKRSKVGKLTTQLAEREGELKELEEEAQNLKEKMIKLDEEMTKAREDVENTVLKLAAAILEEENRKAGEGTQAEKDENSQEVPVATSNLKGQPG